MWKHEMFRELTHTQYNKAASVGIYDFSRLITEKKTLKLKIIDDLCAGKITNFLSILLNSNPRHIVFGFNTYPLLANV